MARFVFIDTEVSEKDNKAYDFGAFDSEGLKIHTGRIHEFQEFIAGADFICGHNIIDHDLKYCEAPENANFIDTLYLSSLLFPDKESHALSKEEKLREDEKNNPLNDSIKAMDLLYDELKVFSELDSELMNIYFLLLKENPYFKGFCRLLEKQFNGSDKTCCELIRKYFAGKICDNAPLERIVSENPLELAYCLSFISQVENNALISPWILKNYPQTDNIMHIIRNTPCNKCEYCNSHLNPYKYLEKYFGYKDFRKYNNEPLQANAVKAALNRKSLIAVFPTGGGKSITFQIPALIAGEAEKALTVVISPLQSLMKDQVDGLRKEGIESAVTINGLLSPLERAEAIRLIEEGIASILYISPESLRSVTIERLLLLRHIDRFVIDEAHCFSAWGQDFRVDYLYIGKFIRELQNKKGNNCFIPVSCFTATAKQKVIADIREYFKKELDIEPELFTTNATRKNLRYEVLYQKDSDKKYETLRSLLEQKNCPAIVYASRTKRTEDIAKKLCMDGFNALPFNGRMDSVEKQRNQDSFINDEVQIIVATSAFGMGVNKPNVGLVIHYDISDSLENYVQEAGRAGRDQNLNAECYILFNEEDLDKHFILLNQTKLSINEIKQVYKAIKHMTKNRPEICCSALEIARQAGWDDSISEIETRIVTAVQALENSGYLEREKNAPHVYATSIIAENAEEAFLKIDKSHRFSDENERLNAKRIIKSLISKRNISKADNADAESRIDYIADRLGIEKSDVIHSVQKMREDGLLADTMDLTAYIYHSKSKALAELHKFQKLEIFMIETIENDKLNPNYKELNEKAVLSGINKSSVNAIKTLIYYWTIQNYIKKEYDEDTHKVTISIQSGKNALLEKRKRSYRIAEFIIDRLYEFCDEKSGRDKEILVGFSVLGLMNAYRAYRFTEVSASDIEEALLFLSKINSIKLEGGFLVLYNRMKLKRLVLNNNKQYTADDYRQLEAFYKQKTQQIHIVGEYANLMIKDNIKASHFVNDYFQMDSEKFISKYFSGVRKEQIKNNITPEKYEQLFGTLSKKQLEIIKDNTSKNIVITAGPGSGKTRVLVHKLASLLLMEDVKHEQLLMLTFSRASAIEFKQRLHALIGNASAFVEIKTFHSYCFDILGKTGNIQESKNIVADAGELIRNGDVEIGRITKTVLVIDEAQDMNNDEFALVKALMERNEEMRVIAVGDDDQNIYEFRDSDSKYMKSLIDNENAEQYSLIENYRSSKSVVAFANVFVKEISSRMKQEDIVAVNDSAGTVKLIKHYGQNMENALVDDVISSGTDGTSCILTNTNHEAFIILGILKQRNIPAKLIQTSGKMFDLYNIAEIRYFIKKLDINNSLSVTISDDVWNKAIEDLRKKYSKSERLPFILEILNEFSSDNKIKYCSDFETFLHESKIEDFYKSEQGVVTVSTIHKSKGKEFDNVFMLLNNPNLYDDKEKRKLYVGITRAKERLHIHYTGNGFDKFAPYASAYETDYASHEKPSELTVQLFMDDVFLNFFKDKKLTILNLCSGHHMIVKGHSMYIDDNGNLTELLRFSNKSIKYINKIISEGYVPCDAKIRFICAWKGKGDTDESAVILPDIYFRYNAG